MLRTPRLVLNGVGRWLQASMCPACPAAGCRVLSGLVVRDPGSQCQRAPSVTSPKPGPSLSTRSFSGSQTLGCYASNTSQVISPDAPMIKIESAKKDEAGATVNVTWADGQQQDYPFIWLLDNCPCPSCYHAESQGRLVSFMSLDADVSPSSVETAAGGRSLRVNWNDEREEHRSDFDSRWLRTMRFDRDPMDAIDYPTHRLWGAEISASVTEFGFRDLMADDAVLLDFLTVFSETGILKVVGMPAEPKQIPLIARRIGLLRDNSFGVIQPLKKGGYNVEQLDSDRALSYTTLGLQLHTDMSCLGETTHMAFFHCIASDCEGGESVYADGFKAAETLRQEDPDAFRALSRSQYLFRLVGEEPHVGAFDHVSYHPTISLDAFGQLKAIHYSTHARLPSLRMSVGDVRPMYKALQKFAKLIEDPDNTYCIKLQPGEMTVVNNHRVLHGRKPFGDAGERYLELGYVDRDHVTSRMRVLKNKMKELPQVADKRMR